MRYYRRGIRQTTKIKLQIIGGILLLVLGLLGKPLFATMLSSYLSEKNMLLLFKLCILFGIVLIISGIVFAIMNSVRRTTSRIMNKTKNSILNTVIEAAESKPANNKATKQPVETKKAPTVSTKKTTPASACPYCGTPTTNSTTCQSCGATL